MGLLCSLQPSSNQEGLVSEAKCQSALSKYLGPMRQPGGLGVLSVLGHLQPRLTSQQVLLQRSISLHRKGEGLVEKATPIEGKQ